MKIRYLTACLSFILLLLAAPAMAGHHLNGTWELHVTLPGQSAGMATFTLKEGEDGALSGTYQGAAGEAEVEGTVDGADVKFAFVSNMIGLVTYKGTYADGKLSGTCDYGMIGQGTFEGGKAE